LALTDLSGAGAKVFGARFNLVNVLPGVLLVLFVAALVRSGAYGVGAVYIDRVLPKSLLSADVAIFLLLTLLIGLLLRPFQIFLVQLLEGYWRPGSVIGTVATELHLRRKHRALIEYDMNPIVDNATELGAVAAAAQRSVRMEIIRSRADYLLERYPSSDDDIMPTMLGNILRTAEEHAGGRYGLDAVIVYPRLYPFLSERLNRAMSQELDQLDAVAGLCVTFLVATTAALPLVRRLDFWSLVPLGTALLAHFAYRGALRAALSHAVLLATAFDLHRFDMVAAMHLPLPETPDDEYEFNENLSLALDRRGAFRTTFLGDHYLHQSMGPKPGAWRKLANALSARLHLARGR
jgi:hypothetical protein